MGDIGLYNMKMDECGLSVSEGDGVLNRKEICLGLANAREGTWPWYSSLVFGSRKEWFKFVKLVNRENRRLKKAPQEEDGFPLFKEG